MAAGVTDKEVINYSNYAIFTIYAMHIWTNLHSLLKADLYKYSIKWQFFTIAFKRLTYSDFYDAIGKIIIENQIEIKDHLSQS